MAEPPATPSPVSSRLSSPTPQTLPKSAEAPEISGAGTSFGSVWAGGTPGGLSLASLRPSGIVFDCDGLLVDTEPCWTVAETAAFAARGLDYGVAQKQVFLGLSVPASVALMARIFDEEGNEPAILDEVLACVADVISAEAEAMPGALELVDRLAGRVPLAVASNSPRHLVELSMARGGLTGRFVGIVAADEVPAPKPAPDLYLHACALLGIDPGTGLAFEDSATGVASARAAGLAVIGVPSLGADGFPADLVLETLTDPRLLAWAEAL